jgi:hypothetical protein
MRDITQLPESSLAKALKGLKKRNIIHTTQTESKTNITYKINSKLSTWKPLFPEKTDSTNVEESLHKRRVFTPQTESSTLYKDKRQKTTTTPSAGAEPEIVNVLTEEERLKKIEVERLREQIDMVTDKLKKSGKFPDVYSFRGKMWKQGKNDRAILHTLEAVLRKSGGFNSNHPSEPFAYAVSIMNKENGNYNEADHRKEAERQKMELAAMLEGIG